MTGDALATAELWTHAEGWMRPPHHLSSSSRCPRSPRGTQEEGPTPAAWGHLGQVQAALGSQSWDNLPRTLRALLVLCPFPRCPPRTTGPSIGGSALIPRRPRRQGHHTFPP